MVVSSREQLASEEIVMGRDLLVAELKVPLDPKARHVAASHQDGEPEGCQAGGQHLCLLSASFGVSSVFSQTLCMLGGHTYLQAKYPLWKSIPGGLAISQSQFPIARSSGNPDCGN